MFHLYLKHAIRVLQKKRSFSIAVIATFAVAIGVNATIFSLRDAILERTLEVADAENLIAVYLTNRVLLGASAIACFLSMLGLYSLIAFSVVRRNREIGIRTALGATRSKILKLMIQRGVVLTALGAVLGVGLAVSSLRVLDSLLYGVKPANPLVLIAAAIVLMSVSLIAGFLPAQRATRIDPMRAIRDE